MSKYAVFFEPTSTGFSAHVPDLPGCVAAASTLEETRQLMREAIEFHVEGMRMPVTLFPRQHLMSRRSKLQSEAWSLLAAQ